MCCPKNFLGRQNLFWRTLISANTCLAFLQSSFHTFVTDLGTKTPEFATDASSEIYCFLNSKGPFSGQLVKGLGSPWELTTPPSTPLGVQTTQLASETWTHTFFLLLFCFIVLIIFCCCCYLFLLSPLLLKQNKIKTNKQTNRISS